MGIIYYYYFLPIFNNSKFEIKLWNIKELRTYNNHKIYTPKNKRWKLLESNEINQINYLNHYEILSDSETGKILQNLFCGWKIID